MTEVVHYAPDKGASYGQALAARGVRGAWEAVQSFLARCTLPDSPESITLSADQATEWDPDPPAAEACIARVVARFGAPHQRQGFRRHWPSGEPLPGDVLTWPGSAETLPEMVAFLVAGEPWPKQTLGPVEVHFLVRFQWRDPLSGELLPSRPIGREGARSELLVTLGRCQFVQPTLWFPFAPADPAFVALLRAVAPALPFALLPRHFRLAVPKRDGSGYRYRRLTEPLPIPAV